MKALYDNIVEMLGSLTTGDLVWWVVLGIIAVVLAGAVVISLFHLHRDIEDIDRTYLKEIDYNSYLPRHR